MKRRKTCPRCSQPVTSQSRYCPHCGTSLLASSPSPAYHCPRCKKVSIGHSHYCKYCGMSRSHHLSHTSLKFFFILIIAVLILLILFVFYNPDRRPSPSSSPALPSISIQNLRCQETATHFVVCGTITWSGPAGSSTLVHLPGGISVDARQRYTQSPFEYCNSLEKVDGFRVLQVTLSDAAQNTLDTVGQGVECTSTASPQPGVSIPPSSQYRYQTTTSFTAQLDRTSRAEGSGTVTIPFPDKVLSCNATGSFFIDNGAKKAGTYQGSIQLYCHGATGSFTSFADSTTQTVTVDPDLFPWNRINRINPEPQTYPSFIYTPTCDTQYVKYAPHHRYFIRTDASGFGSRQLLLDWYYKNDDTKPEVDFTVFLDCLLQE